MDVDLVVKEIDANDYEVIEHIKELAKIKEIKNIILDQNTKFSLPDQIKQKISNTYDETGHIIHFIGPESIISLDRKINCKKILSICDLSIFREERITDKIAMAIDRKKFKGELESATVITDSTQTRDELIDMFDANPSSIFVVNPGVNLNLKHDETKKSGTLGYFGRFGKYERVDKLIEDFISSALSNKMKLVIYGYESDEYINLKDKYEKFGNVIFKDFAEISKLSDIINELDYFVYPASYSGFGLQILESTLCETPCLVYDDANIPTEVKKYAFTINKIDDIISEDQKEIQSKLKEYSKEIRNIFSWDKYREEILNIYSSVMKGEK